MIEQIKKFDYQGRDLAVKVNELIEASNKQEERQDRLERAVRLLAAYNYQQVILTDDVEKILNPPIGE